MMALNKPKYSLYKNGTYALEGFLELLKNESSFKLQVLMFVVLTVTAWLLPIAFVYKAILSISLFIPIMAEVANSSIERVVDLVTTEYHILAKRAKDAGATLVLLSLIVTAGIWASVLVLAFGFVK